MASPRKRVDAARENSSSRFKFDPYEPVSRDDLPLRSGRRTLRERIALWLLNQSGSPSRTSTPTDDVETKSEPELKIERKAKAKEPAPVLEPSTRKRSTVAEPAGLEPTSRSAMSAMERLRAELRSAAPREEVVEIPIEQPIEKRVERSIEKSVEKPTIEAPLISREEISELQQIEPKSNGPSALSNLTTKLSRDASEFFERFSSSAKSAGKNFGKSFSSRMQFKMPAWIGRAATAIDRRHLALAVGMGGLFIFSFAVGRVLLTKQSQTRPDVLDLAGRSQNSEASASIERAPITPPVIERRIDANVPVSATPTRTPKRHYIIIQSYFEKEEAIGAVDVLAVNKISATVEENLPDWSSSGRQLF
ncbi:MAG TPA: hypothetical protein PK402_13285, partial [Tepidisphaeraceae bacterium]|nr:hypothetical protein [Tepidisphaeraceae bacterium]